MNKLLIITAIVSAITITSCADDAYIASKNLSKAADNFEVARRVVFYNGISGEYMLSIEGLCSIEPTSTRLDVTCKTGLGVFKKHFLGLSDNVTYFAEQMESQAVNTYHYRVTFKPQSILPDIDFRGDLGSAVEATTPD